MQPDKLEQRPENNCNASFSHCDSSRCDYGLLKSLYGNCERCECEDPCAGNECPIDSQCFVDVTGQEGETAYVPICRKLKKPGPNGTSVDIRNDEDQKYLHYVDSTPLLSTTTVEPLVEPSTSSTVRVPKRPSPNHSPVLNESVPKPRLGKSFFSMLQACI